MKEEEKEISFVGHASFFLHRTLAAVVCNWGWLLKGQEKEEWGGGNAVKALGRKSLLIAILEKTYGEQELVCKAGRSGLWDLHGDHLFHQREKHKHGAGACQQTSTEASENFTGLKDVIPPCTLTSQPAFNRSVE